MKSGARGKANAVGKSAFRAPLGTQLVLVYLLIAASSLLASCVGTKEDTFATVSPVVRLQIEPLSGVQAGVITKVTVSAHDDAGNVIGGYRGAVNFASTDARALLPLKYYFTANDSGIHVFDVIFGSVGTQSVSVLDDHMFSASVSTTVTAGPIDHFAIGGLSGVITAGVAADITVVAQDSFGNTVTDFIGALTFTSNDTTLVTTPVGSIATGMTLADRGVKKFRATFTRTAQRLGSAVWLQVASGPILGFVSTVPVNPAAIASLQLALGTPTIKHCSFFQAVITALDAFGNTATGWTGNVTLIGAALGGAEPPIVDQNLVPQPLTVAFTSTDRGRKATTIKINNVAAPATTTLRASTAGVPAIDLTINSATDITPATTDNFVATTALNRTINDTFTVQLTNTCGAPVAGGAVAWAKISGPGVVTGDAATAAVTGLANATLTSSGPPLDTIFTATAIGKTITFTASGVQGAWTALTSSAIAGRVDSGAVYLPRISKLLIWGGKINPDLQLHTDYQNDGAMFDAVSNSWSNVVASNLSPRAGHSIVTDGTHAIIWGGHDEARYFSDGAIYDPLKDTWGTQPWTSTDTHQVAWQPMSMSSAPVARAYHSAVLGSDPKGGLRMIVWGGWSGDGALGDGAIYELPLMSSYLNIATGVLPESGKWSPMPATMTGAPAPRAYHTAVWADNFGTSDRGMIVWGGKDAAQYLNSGAIFRFATGGETGTWEATSLTNAPTARAFNSGVWDNLNKRLLIWGGFNGSYLGTGAMFNPALNASDPTNAWVSTTTLNAPTARAQAATVWTGRMMMILGGKTATDCNNGLYTYPDSRAQYCNDLAIYEPAVNRWGVIKNAAGLSQTNYTGTGDGTLTVNALASAADTETITVTCTVAAPNSGTFSVTGSRSGALGFATVGTPFVSTKANFTINDGPADFIVGDRFILSSQKMPTPASASIAAWTGDRMLIWGGMNSDGAGGYTLGQSTWTFEPGATVPGPGWNAVPAQPGTWNTALASQFTDPSSPATPAQPLVARAHAASVWTGSRFIVWGGCTSVAGGECVGGSELHDGYEYDPIANSWQLVASAGSFAARYDHTATWTGKEMIIWGGAAGGVSIATGARYNPVTRIWANMAIPVIDCGGGFTAQLSAFKHGAAWTGTEFAVWGGLSTTRTNCGGPMAATPINVGARYYLQTDTWAIITAGALTARHSHAMFNAGNAIVIWGGFSANGQVGPQNNGGAIGWPGGILNIRAFSPVGPCVLANPAAAVGPRGNLSAVIAGSADYNPPQPANPLRGATIFLWGGTNGANLHNDGCALRVADAANPSETWYPIDTNGGIAPFSAYNSAVWTGQSMLVYGRADNTPGVLNQLWEYTPAPDGLANPGRWRQLAAPGIGPRLRPEMQWLGSMLMLWGGDNIGAPISAAGVIGATFTPTHNSW